MPSIRTQCTTFVAACLIASAPAVLSAQVGPNDVAWSKPAFQSSDYYQPAFAAGKAVDGNTDGDYSAWSLGITSFDTQAWWYVDLGANFNISSITLWNRTDNSGGRLSNFFLSVLASSTSNVSAFGANTVWETYNVGPVGASATFTPPPGTVGQYVKVQLDHQDYLQLAEVDVEGQTAIVTPEPSSLALMATGLAGVFARRRRRQA